MLFRSRVSCHGHLVLFFFVVRVGGEERKEGRKNRELLIVGKQKMCSSFLYDGCEREREKKKKNAIKNERWIRVVTLNRTLFVLKQTASVSLSLEEKWV